MKSRLYVLHVLNDLSLYRHRAGHRHLLQGVHVTLVQLHLQSDRAEQGKVHGLINFIDTRVKCRHLKKLTCRGTMRGRYLSDIDWRYSWS
jgi:hypothetical protein